MNSQSSLGSGSGSPAAVGFLGAASPALPSSLYPAGPSLLAAAPRHTSRPLLSLGPDAQQTRRFLTGSNQLLSHVDVFGCSPRAALAAYGCHSKTFKWGSKPYHSSSAFIYVKVCHSPGSVIIVVSPKDAEINTCGSFLLFYTQQSKIRHSLKDQRKPRTTVTVHLESNLNYGIHVHRVEPVEPQVASKANKWVTRKWVRRTQRSNPQTAKK